MKKLIKIIPLFCLLFGCASAEDFRYKPTSVLCAELMQESKGRSITLECYSYTIRINY